MSTVAGSGAIYSFLWTLWGVYGLHQRRRATVALPASEEDPLIGSASDER